MNLETIWKSAKEGDKKSQFELAKRYEQINNIHKALKWYETVAEQGISDKLDESFNAKCRLVAYYWKMNYMVAIM